MTSQDLHLYLIALLAMATTFSLGATWEDPPPSRVRTTPVPRATQPATQRNNYPAPAQRRPQPAPAQRTIQPAPRTHQPAPQRTTQPAQRTSYQEPPQLQRNAYQANEIEDLYSQHLDANRRNLYSYGGAYTAETVFGPYGVTDIAEANLEFRLFKFDEFLGGRIDAWMSANLMYFIENPEMEALPDALLAASFDIGQTWRFVNGWSTEIRVAPGIYSDVTSPSFGIPTTLNFYFAVNPELSLQLGGTFRPSWDIPFIPNVGIAWQPVDQFRLEAMLPKSKVVLFPEYILSLFATYEWRNVTYALAGDDGLPDSLTLDDMLVTAGVALCPFGDFTLTGEYGVFISREMSADVDENEAFDLSKESFIRVMLKGSF